MLLLFALFVSIFVADGVEQMEMQLGPVLDKDAYQPNPRRGGQMFIFV